MQESAQGTKKTTSVTRSNIYENDIQIMNSSKISEAGLISNAKDFNTYWNQSCLEMSRKLLSLTKTGYVGSDLSSSNLLQPKTIAKSWFVTNIACHQEKNLSKISSLLSMSSPVEFTDSGSTLVKCRKIRIYPKNLQTAKKYLGLSRYWFNKAIEYLNQKGTKASLIEVRKIQKLEHPAWAFDCPQRIREWAINDACEAVKNCKKKFLNGQGINKVAFRRKKDTKQSFGFDPQSISETFVFKEKERKLLFYATEKFQKPSICGTRVIYENGRWFLIIPVEVPIKKPENQRLGAVALDPGVRNFLAFFSESHHGTIGSHDFSRILRLCYHMDELISKASKAKARQKRRMKKALQRMRWKIRNLVDDLHRKTAHFLVKWFDVIYFPKFRPSEMVTKLHSKVARSMLSFAHHRFAQFLKFKAKEYSAQVIEVSEAFTSRTCSYCGKQHVIGSKKVLKCSCGAKVDRDLNGARGIYLRALSASTFQSLNNESLDAFVNFC